MRFALVLLSLAPLYSQVPNGGAASSYDTETKQALGARLAAEVRQSARSVASPAVDDYIARIGAKLAASFADAQFTYRFTVIKDDTFGGIHEPLAVTGGYIFVPAKLFVDAGSEAEFAGMLAHAMAHVEARHGQNVASTSPEPGIVMGGLTQLASYNSAFPLGLVREQRAFETEADALAVQVMAKAGYDPEAFVHYINRVQPPQVGADKAQSPLPARESRTAEMRDIIQQLPAREYSSGAEFSSIQEEARRSLAK